MDFQWIRLEKILRMKSWASIEDSTWKSKILKEIFVYYLMFYVSF